MRTGIAAEVAGRRAVLAGLGVVGAGTLAACSSGGTSSSGATASASGSASTPAAAVTASAPPGGTSASAPPSAAAATSAAAPGSAAPTSAAATSPAVTSAAATSAAAAPAGFAVAESQIPVGGGKYFEADAVIITQPTAGSFRAFTSVCTHQGCPVTMISGGLMTCPCHGSQYSIKDGSVVTGPAPKPLAAKVFTIADGKVVVAKT